MQQRQAVARSCEADCMRSRRARRQWYVSIKSTPTLRPYSRFIYTLPSSCECAEGWIRAFSLWLWRDASWVMRSLYFPTPALVAVEGRARHSQQSLKARRERVEVLSTCPGRHLTEHFLVLWWQCLEQLFNPLKKKSCVRLSVCPSVRWSHSYHWILIKSFIKVTIICTYIGYLQGV